MKKFLLLALLFVGPMFLSASHLVGGAIHVAYDSSSASHSYYRVDLTLIRDYAGISLGPTANIQVADTAKGTVITVSLNRDTSFTATNNIWMSLEVHHYSGLVALDTASMYRFSFNNCCRAPGFDNVPSSTGFNFYIETWQRTDGRNSSPVARLAPPFALPRGLHWQRLWNAHDVDGDSLFYEITFPLSGAGMIIDNVNPWNGMTMPLGASVDANGMYQYTDTSNVDMYLMLAYKVSSYRNNTFVGSVLYDYPCIIRLLPAMFSSGGPVVTVDGNPNTGIHSFRLNNVDTLDIETSMPVGVPNLMFKDSVDMSQWDTIITDSLGHYTLGLTFRPTTADVGDTISAYLEYEYDGIFVYTLPISFTAISDIGLNPNAAPVVRMYPNPTNEEIHLTFESAIARLRIVDMSGRVLQETALPEGVREWQGAAPEKAGRYNVQLINSRGQVVVLPLVVQ